MFRTDLGYGLDKLRSKHADPNPNASAHRSSIGDQSATDRTARADPRANQGTANGNPSPRRDSDQAGCNPSVTGKRSNYDNSC